MPYPFADPAGPGTSRSRSKKPRVHRLHENVRPSRARAIFPRIASFLPALLDCSSRALFSFSVCCGLLRRSQQSCTGAHHSPIGPALFAKENFALAGIAVKPSSQEPKVLAEVIHWRHRSGIFEAGT